MNATVLTEENFDGMFLAALIASERLRDGIQIRVGGGESPGHSFARTMLAVRRTPVAVVINADSPEPKAAMERQSSAEEVIGIAAFGVPFRVLVAVPELDILFFQRPELLSRVFGVPISDHVMELAQLSPRRALKKIDGEESLENIRVRLLRAMNATDLEAFRATELIQDLLSFIKVAVEFSSHSLVSGASQ
jgi:hypothetical protein